MDNEKFKNYVNYCKLTLMLNTPFWGFMIKQVDVILLSDEKYGSNAVSEDDEPTEDEEFRADDSELAALLGDIKLSKSDNKSSNPLANVGGKKKKSKKNFGIKTNGKNIFVQESYFNSLSKQQFFGQYYKQLLHIAFLHVPRKYNKDDKAWNIACDYWVNIVLDDFKNNKVNKIGNYIDYDPIFFDKKYEDKSIEEIYDDLVDEDGDGDKKGKGDKIPEDYEPNLDYKSKERLTGEDVENIKSNLAKGSALTNMNGLDGNHIRREIDKILEKKVDWRQELKQFIQAFPNDYNFLERDRRFFNSPFFIPSIGGETVKLVVALDTSGSIIDDILKYFVGEVINICQTFPNVELTVICCDAAVNSVGKVYTLQDVDNLELKGGGGTSFVPVFEYVDDNLSDYNALIYFTDGYGEFPNDEVVNIKTLWIMTTEVKPSFGKIIKFDINQNNQF
jgi:predicted metal-dependent peptidase